MDMKAKVCIIHSHALTDGWRVWMMLNSPCDTTISSVSRTACSVDNLRGCKTVKRKCLCMKYDMCDV